MMEGWIWTCLRRQSPRGRAGLALLLPLLHRPGTQGELGRDLLRGPECGRGAQWAGRHDGLCLTPPGCPLEVPGLSLSPSHLKISVAPQVSMERGPHYGLTVIIAPQGSNLGSYSPAALPRPGAETLNHPHGFVDLPTLPENTGLDFHSSPDTRRAGLCGFKSQVPPAPGPAEKSLPLAGL